MSAELSPIMTLGDVELILIPAGEFTMGADDGHENEKPPHKVHLDAFYIGKYPITNAQYKRFVKATGHRTPDHWSGDSIPESKEDHPVVNVNWHEARAFCQWLADETGYHVRLPTEAEWEKAARGTDGRAYPWGDQFDAAKCNSGEDDIDTTTPVGQYSPQGDSPYGVADMAGNVWEWTSSRSRRYPYDPDDGREDPDGLGAPVTRSAPFGSRQFFIRSACRDDMSSNYRHDTGGFRVAVSPSSPE